MIGRLVAFLNLSAELSRISDMASVLVKPFLDMVNCFRASDVTNSLYLYRLSFTSKLEIFMVD